MKAEKSEVLQGTLDLMILKTLYALGPQHGFGIARRIEQMREQVLNLNCRDFSNRAGSTASGAHRRTTGRRNSTR